jgi:hypothetical protein
MTRMHRIADAFRENIRHLLALFLAAGTLAGTLWTFSDGRLTLNGIAEIWTSVGGIAMALELGVIYVAWFVGEIDHRLKTARKAEDVEQFGAQKSDLLRWFYGTLLISIASNVYFRYNQLGNIWLALFVGIAPAPLIILFAIKLRPIVPDFNAIGRRAVQESMIASVKEAGHVLKDGLRRLSMGEVFGDADRQRILLAVSILGVYAPQEENRALMNTVSQAGLLPAPANGPGDDIWLTSEDVAAMYDISRSNAQKRMRDCPQRRQRDGRTWIAPARAMYERYGIPSVSSTPINFRNRTPKTPPETATTTAETAPITAIVTEVPADAVPIGQ